MPMRLVGISGFLALLWTAVAANEDAITRIFGGEDAEPGRYAYMVSLQSTSTLSHFCGGFLVSPDVVLTAAHCVVGDSIEDIAVRTRPYRLNRPLEPSEIFPVLELAVHPEYGVLPDSERDDVALIKLNGTSLNQPLLTVNSDPELPFVGQVLTQMGWGNTETDLDIEVLQVLQNSTYINETFCDELILEASIKYPFINAPLASEGMICTLEGGNEGACFGDSGGPLIVPGMTAEEDIVVGIVSWGYDCADATVPSVFSRMSFHFDYIRRNLCRMSDYSPAYFDCDGLPDTNTPSVAPVAPTASPEPSFGTLTLITVRLLLDLNPEGVSWSIQTLGGKVLYEVEPGTYTETFEFVSTTISVPFDEILNFVITDEFGFGFYTSSFGADDGANVFLGDRADVTKLLAKVLPVFGGTVTTSFTSSEEGIIPTLASNPPSAAPTVTLSPTVATTTIDVTLVIKFDTYPVQTLWFLNNLDTNETVTEGGPYSPFIGDNVTETISLIANNTYVLVVVDLASNGICCDDGEGEIFIYLGTEPRDDQVLVYDNGQFEMFSFHVFTAAANETFSATQAPSASPSMTSSPTQPIVNPFFVTLRIYFDFFPFETSWEVVTSTNVTLYEGAPTLNETIFLEETLVLEEGERYTFIIYDSFGDGICCGGFGIVTAGAFYSEEATLAVIPGNFADVAFASFDASLDGVFNFTPPFVDFTFSPTSTPRPSMAITDSPSLSPSMSAVPTTAAQTLVTIELKLSFSSYGTAAISIERTDTGRKVFQATGFDFLDVIEGWNTTISLDLGREYLFTITDQLGVGEVDSFVYLGTNIDITQTIMAMEGLFGFVRKQFFVASEEGLLGFTMSPTVSTSPSVQPSLSSAPSVPPSVSSRPSVSFAPSGSPVPVLVVIQFDAFPEDVSWIILDSEGDVVFDVPFFTYSDGDEFAVESVVLTSEEEYTIIFVDLGFDGYCCFSGEGQAFVFLGDEPDQNNVLVYEDGQFVFQSNHTFVTSPDDVLPASSVPAIPPLPTPSPSLSSSPTSTPSTSASPSISSAPTRSPVDVLVMIQLDDFPSETSWWIVGPDETIVIEVPSSTYGGMPGEVVTKVVTLQTGAEYVFNMGDLATDGICCSFGVGSAFVFLGTEPDADKILVYENGLFGDLSSHTFVASEDGILSILPLPDIPDLPPTTAAPVTPAPVVPPTPAPVIQAPMEAPVMMKKKRKGKKGKKDDDDNEEEEKKDKKKRKGQSSKKGNYSD